MPRSLTWFVYAEELCDLEVSLLELVKYKDISTYVYYGLERVSGPLVQEANLDHHNPPPLPQRSRVGGFSFLSVSSQSTAQFMGTEVVKECGNINQPSKTHREDNHPRPQSTTFSHACMHYLWTSGVSPLLILLGFPLPRVFFRTKQQRDRKKAAAGRGGRINIPNKAAGL